MFFSFWAQGIFQILEKLSVGKWLFKYWNLTWEEPTYIKKVPSLFLSIETIIVSKNVFLQKSSHIILLHCLNARRSIEIVAPFKKKWDGRFMLGLVSYIFQPNFETTKSFDRRAVKQWSKIDKPFGTTNSFDRRTVKQWSKKDNSHWQKWIRIDFSMKKVR